jgi:hypothetical protein
MFGKVAGREAGLYSRLDHGAIVGVAEPELRYYLYVRGTGGVLKTIGAE